MKKKFSVMLPLLALIFVVAAVDNDSTDFYDILQLPEREDASEKEIKTNWRRLSREHHPDLKGEGSREAYKKIQRAYEVLSDKRKRKVYDMKGEEGIRQLEKAGAAGQQQQHMDPLMRMFFGGGGGDGGGVQKGSNVQLVLLCTLEDVYRGASHTVKLSKQRLCKQCRGTGAASKEDFQECPACNGQGTVVQRIQLAPGFVQQVQQQCSRCNGAGKIVKRKCPACKGNKVTRIEQSLHVDIEEGTPENHNIVFEMEADQSPDQLPGDVIFTVQTAPHPVFVRDGDNLSMKVKLSLAEALLGFTRTFEHLDGHTVELTEAGITEHGTKRTVSDEGMPKHNVPSERGSLVVTYEVELPSFVTSEQRTMLERLF